MGSFVGYRLVGLKAPINGPVGRAFATAIGSAQDDAQPLLLTAGRIRSTLKCPDDGLAPVLGSTYARAMAPRETLDPDSYRARLAGAWGFWETAPLSSGIASLFDVYRPNPIFPPPPVVVTGSVATGLPSWSEFVIVWPSDLRPDTTWDDDPSDAYDDGGLWEVFYDPLDPYTDPSFGVDDLAWLRRQIRLCKGAGSYPVTVAVGLFGGASLNAIGSLFDDNSRWDISDPGAVWDTQDAPYTYLPLGHAYEEDALFGYGGAAAWDATPGATWDSGDEDAYFTPYPNVSW